MFPVTPVSPCVGVRPTVVSYQTYSRRWKATVSGTGNTTTGEEEGEETVESWLEKARKRSWLWRWLNDIHEIEAQVSLLKQKHLQRKPLWLKCGIWGFFQPSPNEPVCFVSLASSIVVQCQTTRRAQSMKTDNRYQSI